MKSFGGQHVTAAARGLASEGRHLATPPRTSGAAGPGRGPDVRWRHEPCPLLGVVPPVARNRAAVSRGGGTGRRRRDRRPRGSRSAASRRAHAGRGARPAAGPLRGDRGAQRRGTTEPSNLSWQPHWQPRCRPGSSDAANLAANSPGTSSTRPGPRQLTGTQQRTRGPRPGTWVDPRTRRGGAPDKGRRRRGWMRDRRRTGLASRRQPISSVTG